MCVDMLLSVVYEATALMLAKSLMKLYPAGLGVFPSRNFCPGNVVSCTMALWLKKI